MWEGKCMQVDTSYLHWPNNPDLHREVKLMKLTTINTLIVILVKTHTKSYKVQYFDMIVDHEFKSFRYILIKLKH